MMMPPGMLWILAEDGRTPIQCGDVIKWAKWVEQNAEGGYAVRVAEDYVAECRVSTVFLARSTAVRSAKPDVFETMVFTADSNEPTGIQLRYSTWEEAEPGHQWVVELVGKDGVN